MCWNCSASKAILSRFCSSHLTKALCIRDFQRYEILSGLSIGDKLSTPSTNARHSHHLLGSIIRFFTYLNSITKNISWLTGVDDPQTDATFATFFQIWGLVLNSLQVAPSRDRQIPTPPFNVRVQSDNPALGSPLPPSQFLPLTMIYRKLSKDFITNRSP